MFRLLRVKPPHGWNAVAWELGIVTLGVLIALWAQQWVEGRKDRDRLDRAMAQLRAQNAKNFEFEIERYVATPCVKAQVVAIRNHLLQPTTRGKPYSLYEDVSFTYAIRAPYRPLLTSAWRSMESDGTAALLNDETRLELSNMDFAFEDLNALTKETYAALGRIKFAARTTEFTPQTRDDLLLTLEEIEQNFQLTALYIRGQLPRMKRFGMEPSEQSLRSLLNESGTLKFCRAHNLPLGDWKE